MSQFKTGGFGRQMEVVQVRPQVERSRDNVARVASKTQPFRPAEETGEVGIGFLLSNRICPDARDLPEGMFEKDGPKAFKEMANWIIGEHAKSNESLGQLAIRWAASPRARRMFDDQLLQFFVKFFSSQYGRKKLAESLKGRV